MSGPNRDTFSTAATSHRILNTQLVQDNEQIQIEAIAVFLIIFRPHLQILVNLSE